jgi:hypothetical protein
VVLGHNAPHWDGTIANLSDDAVVVDGWTGDYYQAKEPFSVLNAFRYGGPPNPFQTTVRYNIQNASGNIKVVEHVRWRDWAESFSPHFRLACADHPTNTYEPQGSYLLRVRQAGTWKDARDNRGWDEAKAIQYALLHLAAGNDDYLLADD